jgi:Mce-associated membrane protein
MSISDTKTEADAKPESTATADEKTEVIDSAEPAESTDPEPAEPSGKRPALLVPLVLGAAILVLAIVVGFFTYQAIGNSHTQRDRDAALDAARTASAQALSYNSDTIDADIAKTKALLTGKFAADFDQLATQFLLPASKQAKLSTSAEVTRAAVIESGSQEAKVLLFVNQTVRAATAPQPATGAAGMKVTMSLTDGKWLISNIEPV